MGEYIDVGIQTSILPLSIILSSIVLGIFALFGEETENDDWFLINQLFLCFPRMLQVLSRRVYIYIYMFFLK